MNKLVIVSDDNGGKLYPIQPQHIDASGYVLKITGRTDDDVSAKFIVGLCQKNGGWKPFTREEVYKFSNQAFWLNGLLGRKNRFVVLEADGFYRVTHEFISRCFEVSPAITHPE